MKKFCFHSDFSIVSDNKPPEQFPDGIISYSFYGEGQNQAHVALEAIAQAFDIKPEANRPPAMRAKEALAGKKLLLYLDGTENTKELQKVIAATDPNNNCVLITTTSEKQVKFKRYVHELIEIDALPLGQATSLLQELSQPYAVDESTTERIYGLVGGLTLALELAGHRFAKVKTKKEAADYLDWLEKLPFEKLSLGKRRLESVEALIRYNVYLLSEGARLVMATAGLLAFAPFPGEVMAKALAVSETDTMEPLTELINYSLLKKTDERFVVKHNLVHRYAREKMKTPNELFERVAAYYTELAKLAKGAE